MNNFKQEFREDKLVRDVQATVINNVLKLIEKEIEYCKTVNFDMFMGMRQIEDVIKREFDVNE